MVIKTLQQKPFSFRSAIRRRRNIALVLTFLKSGIFLLLKAVTRDGIHPVLEERFFQLGNDKPVGTHPQPEIVILCKKLKTVVSIACQDSSADHDAGMGNAVGSRQEPANVLIRRSFFVVEPRADLISVFINHCYHDRNHGAIGVALKVLDLFGQAGRQTDIVAVHSGDVFAPGQINAPVKGRSYAQILAINYQPDPRVVVGCDNCDTAVRGTIVNDEEFEIREGLFQDAFKRFADKSLAIEKRHQNGYFRR